MPRLLLVEDNPGDVELVRRRLIVTRGPPFELLVEETLDEGLATCRAREPDVVLLDLNLPDSSGLETVSSFRRGAPDVPLVVLTGTDDIDTGLDALRRGADDYVPKGNPSGVDLVRALSYAVERRRMLISIEREREEKQRLYDEAQRVAQAREHVLQVVSHDLRNHVSTIQFALPLLRTGSPDQTRRIDALERVTATLRRLLEDLVDMAAIEKGGLLIELKAEDGVQLLDDAYEAFLPSMQLKGIAFQKERGCESAPVSADRERILQVLGNLLGNAQKFTPAGGRVVVACGPHESGFVFRVEDSGPGIAPEERERVFDRFYRSANARGHGAGLGLAIAKGLVEAHHGRMWVDSEPGLGATFSFALPRLVSDAVGGP